MQLLDGVKSFIEIESLCNQLNQIDKSFTGTSALGFKVSPLQVPLVWSRKSQVRFIEDIWQGFPLKELVITSEDDSNNNLVLYGLSELTALENYLKGEFKVSDKAFTELKSVDQSDFLRRTIPVISLKNPSDYKVRKLVSALNEDQKLFQPYRLIIPKRVIYEFNLPQAIIRYDDVYASEDLAKQALEKAFEMITESNIQYHKKTDLSVDFTSGQKPAQIKVSRVQIRTEVR